MANSLLPPKFIRVFVTQFFLQVSFKYALSRYFSGLGWEGGGGANNSVDL